MLWAAPFNEQHSAIIKLMLYSKIYGSHFYESYNTSYRFSENFFSIVEMDEHGKVMLQKTLKRAQVLPFLAHPIISNLWNRIKTASEQILIYYRELAKQVRHNPVSKRLLTIPGVGKKVKESK